MKKLIVAAGVLCVATAVAAPHASAATVGDVAAALAAPANAAQATNDWSTFAKLSGAKWQGSAPKRGGNAYYWNAKMPIDGAGTGEIALVGGQKLVQSATVNWPKDIKLAKVPEMLAAQFPKDAKLEQVRGACPDERLSGSRIYRANTGWPQTALPAHPVRGGRSWRLHVDDRDGAPAQQAVDLLNGPTSRMAYAAKK